VDLVDGGQLPLALPQLVEALRISTNLHEGDPGRAEAAAEERMHRIRLGLVLRESPRLLRLWLHKGHVRSAVFSPDGGQVATAGSDSVARVWDVASGGPVGLPLRHDGALYQVSFSPDGKGVLTACADGTARVWEVANGREVCRSPRHGGDVYSAVRDTKTGESVGPRLKPGGAVIFAAFDPAGSRLLTTTSEGDGQVWDPATGRPLTPPLAHASAVLFGAFSPDGRVVATCSDDNSCRVWDAATGEPLTPFMKHAGSVYRAVFSPDSRCLLTASEGGTACLWAVSCGERLSPPLDPDGWARQVFASPSAADAWKLPLEGRPVEELTVEAQWLSGHHIDEKTRGLEPNLPKQLQALKELIQTRHPELLNRLP
jgi:WD40 repeat protein